MYEAGALKELGRIAAALERMADADERRNGLLEEDRAERRVAWERDREERERVLAAIEDPPVMLLRAAQPEERS